ncbi:hypothetical protein [Aquimarina sp. RZ0]|uniref:hypothetical protein n=1 Tax=Aquimarina sp. RZ0 TaxID=2607730 RepID=UPI0011F3506F|nr:hypothetical protein [Aquimarina sp. RZ0]KAA1246907.1 hypothetical protein F0000_05460 [Aquimarina sp. RZ0]
MNTDTQNQVDLTTAEDWTAAWRTQCPENCKAFLIPAVDLIEVLNEMGILDDATAQAAQNTATQQSLDIRAYMAIGAEPPSKIPEERLLIVGTQKDSGGVYRDIINGKIDDTGEKIVDIEGSGIFDFTLPCPTSCDDNSPLN